MIADRSANSLPQIRKGLTVEISVYGHRQIVIAMRQGWGRPRGKWRNERFPAGNCLCVKGLKLVKAGCSCRRRVRDYSRHDRAHRFEQFRLSVLQTSLQKPIPFPSGLGLFARRTRTTNIDAMGNQLPLTGRPVEGWNVPSGFSLNPITRNPPP